MGKFYAVAIGKQPGVYDTWDECKENTLKYPNARYKSFEKEEDAWAFVNSANILYDEKQKDVSYNTLAFVDGSFNIKTKVFGWGGFIIHKNGDEREKYIIQGCSDSLDMSKQQIEELAKMRNVAGEIYGAKAAIEKAIELGFDNLIIYYDYEGIEMWATGQWSCKKEGTKKYQNFCNSVRGKISLKFVKVKGHTGIEGNEEVDKLAKEACGVIQKKENKETESPDKKALEE